jgi:hypothetical protein
MGTKASAQGTKLTLGAAIAAKTITAITKANPGVFTSAAHGLPNGAVVQIAAVVGMVEVNGKVGVVVNSTTNTFSIAGLDTTSATTYTSGGTATGIAAQVANVQQYNGFDGSKGELDVTDFDSVAKEYIPGLQDFGQISFDLFLLDSDVGQMALQSNMAGNNQTSLFTITLPTGNTRSFQGFVKSFNETGGVDSPLKRSCTVRVSGNVTRT